MVTWVLYLCIGLVIGGMAGFYFAKMDDFSRKQKKSMEEKLQKSEQELIAYKDQVTSHFKETATLINNMTESYQKVHEHLAQGVVQLCSNAVEVEKLQVSPNQLLTESKDQSVAELAESEAPKTNTKEAVNKNREDQVANVNVSAASTAAEETGVSEMDVSEEPRISESEGQKPSEAAVASPDSTPIQPEQEQTHSDKSPSQPDFQEHPPETMAVAEELEEPATESDKLHVPGSRTVH
ncbi:ZapG family protein [Kaarinaea lacus]